VLSALQEAGLVARRPDERDGRIIRLTITRDGTAVLKRLRSRKNAYLAKRLRVLDDDELATLERATVLIERLLESDEPTHR
jgi:DNA-binding MarR family transcriptional regulator